MPQILDQETQLVGKNAFRAREKLKVELVGRLEIHILVNPVKYPIGHSRPDMRHLRLKMLEDSIRALRYSQVPSGCCLIDRRSGDLGTVVPESALLHEPRGQTSLQALVETLENRLCSAGNKIPASGTR